MCVIESRYVDFNEELDVTPTVTGEDVALTGLEDL